MILSFDKPKKLRPTTEHNDMYQSDTNVAGTYVPNMSLEDKLKWKAKKFGGTDPRIEIRKTVQGIDPSLRYPNISGQMLMVVRESGVVISANSRLAFDNQTLAEFCVAIAEAKQILNEKD